MENFHKNKNLLILDENLKKFKTDMDILFNINIKKLEFIKSNHSSHSDYFFQLNSNFSNENNSDFQIQLLKSFKLELESFRSSNFLTLKNFVNNLEKEYYEKQKYLNEIINSLEMKIHSEEEYPDININSNNQFNPDENLIINKTENQSIQISNFDNFSKKGQKMSQDSLSDSKKTKMNYKNNKRYVSNRPKNDYWKDSKDDVSCALCGISSNKINDDKKLGPLYGPFQMSKKMFYIHEMCAMYSPNIYINKDNQLQNVCYQISKSKKLNCFLCKNSGASVICCTRSCKKIYHYFCGKQDGCHFDNQTFDVNCSDHMQDKVYGEDLNSDILCVVCRSGLDEDLLLLCSDCGKAYHTYCHKPKLSTIPEKEWNCKECDK